MAYLLLIKRFLDNYILISNIVQERLIVLAQWILEINPMFTK